MGTYHAISSRVVVVLLIILLFFSPFTIAEDDETDFVNNNNNINKLPLTKSNDIIQQQQPSIFHPTRISQSSTISLPPPSSISTPSLSNSTTNSTNSNSTINNGTSNAVKQMEVCLDCISFMQKNIATLIVIIEKVGVIDTCQKLCGMLNSTVDIDACTVMCDAIGVEAFWQLFVKVGINPIYACELVNACIPQKYPAVTFTSSIISPPSGPPGTTFEFKMQFTVVNETGVGETAFVVYFPTESGYDIGFISQDIFPDYIPGDYQANVTFPTNSTFLAGKYLIIFDLCSGACGQEPEIYPFASEEIAFNITQLGD